MNHDAVDDDVNRVLFLLVQSWRLIEFIHSAVDSHTDKALTTQAQKHLLILALAVSNNRGQEEESSVFGKR